MFTENYPEHIRVLSPVYILHTALQGHWIMQLRVWLFPLTLTLTLTSIVHGGVLVVVHAQGGGARRDVRGVRGRHVAAGAAAQVDEAAHGARVRVRGAAEHDAVVEAGVAAQGAAAAQRVHLRDMRYSLD